MTTAKRICGVYEVYDTNNVLLARGFKEDVAKVLGCNPSYVSTYSSKDYYYKGKYRVVLVDKVDRNVEYEFGYIPKRETPPEIPEYILYHIKKDGNTSLPDGDPNYYLNYLRENGYECYARKVVEPKGIGKRQKVYYIAEVIT
jgi:hypothetical protein